MRREKIKPGYFDRLYAESGDPWGFSTSAYEREKYAATLDALPRAAYPRALEIGCSIGVFTRGLAPRCGRLLALDCAEGALTSARRRCAGLSNVSFVHMTVPDQWPDGAFDLVTLSEVVYYFDRAGVARLAARVRDALAPQGQILLVHWLGETDYPLGADEAVTAFLEASRDFAAPLLRRRQPEYRLDLLQAGQRRAARRARPWRAPC
ncbi:class I SAM-dependent DNA methyltransferase [Methylocella sp.]|uniref:class I SAM-dependent DNA methyltransferase n=1 Tax=Methylocella sp. TaxID=1978226 RepID=UPI003784B1C5